MGPSTLTDNLKKLSGVGVVLAVLLCLPTDLRSQSPDHRLTPRITFSLGGSFASSGRSFTVDGEAFRSRLVKGGLIAVRGAIDLGSEWSAEGGYTYGPNTLQVTGLDNDFLPERRFDVRIHRLDVGVVRYFTTDGGLSPFVNVGIGLSYFAPTPRARRAAESGGFAGDSVSMTASTKLALVLGGGMEARFTSVLGVRVSVRDNFTGIPRFGLADSYPVSGMIHGIETSIGAVFYLP